MSSRPCPEEKDIFAFGPKGTCYYDAGGNLVYWAWYDSAFDKVYHGYAEVWEQQKVYNRWVKKHKPKILYESTYKERRTIYYEEPFNDVGSNTAAWENDRESVPVHIGESGRFDLRTLRIPYYKGYWRFHKLWEGITKDCGNRKPYYPVCREFHRFYSLYQKGRVGRYDYPGEGFAERAAVAVQAFEALERFYELTTRLRVIQEYIIEPFNIPEPFLMKLMGKQLEIKSSLKEAEELAREYRKIDGKK